MLRACLAVIASFALAGCWASEQRFFGDADWVHLDLDGDYKSVDAGGDEQARVTLRTRPDGLIEGTSTDLDDGKVEQSIIGLVRIDRRSGRFFLMVDRSNERDGGDFYFVAHLTDEGALEFFWPDCEGTPLTDGVMVEQESFKGPVTCMFSSKAALMEAAQAAERFLSAKHIIAVAPMGRLVPEEDPAEIVE